MEIPLFIVRTFIHLNTKRKQNAQ